MFKRSNTNLFKELEFLGFDPIAIKEVLKQHKTFDSALNALNSQESNKLNKELETFNIPKSAIKILSSKFTNIDHALNFYFEYQENLNFLEYKLNEIGFGPQYISHCLSQLWNLEECLKNSRTSSNLKNEERKLPQRSNLEIVDTSRESVRFSINSNIRNSRVFEVQRESVRGNFEETFEELTGNLRRGSIRRRGLNEIPEPPQPREPVIEEVGEQIPNNEGPSGTVTIINLPLLIEAAMNGDEIGGLLLLRILAQLFPKNGLTETDLEKLENFKYELGTVVKNETCTICYEDFEPGKEIIRLPCEHCFDSECIRTWLENSNLCPLCKFEIKPEENS